MIRSSIHFTIGALLMLFSTVDAGQVALLQHSENIVIAVGSTNPVKVQAVRNALHEEKVRIIYCSADSMVNRQPLSDEETLQGAINRANNCLKKTGADLAIGLEGGVQFRGEQPYLCHWGAIVDKKGMVYFTNGPLVKLPAPFRLPLLEGTTLQELMQEFFGFEELGSKEGALGVFTQNRVTREQMLTQIVQVLIGQYCYYEGITLKKLD